MAERTEVNSLFAGVGCVATAVAAIWTGLITPAEAACFAAGGVLASMFLATPPVEVRDPLHPARLQLARLRRSERAANVMVSERTSSRPVTGRRASLRR